jgi:Flp pilus assembly protein TadD
VSERCLWEKVPLLVLSLICSIVTVRMQHQAGSLATIENIPLLPRIENALLAYAAYVGKMVCPVDMAVLYPLAPIKNHLAVAAAGLALLAISAAVSWAAWRGCRYPAVGWFWYLGTLVPVIGLMWVGEQWMADRYTYIPLVGLFLAIAFGAAELTARLPHQKIILACAAAVALGACMVIGWIQVGYWTSEERLFRHTLAVTADNPITHNNLGVILARQGRLDEALREFKSALDIRPAYAESENNTGTALGSLGRTDEAIRHFRRALELKPEYPEAHNGLGNVLLNRGQADEAIRHFREAIRCRPGYVDACCNLANALLARGDLDQAVDQFREVLKVDPGNLVATFNLGAALARQEHTEAAMEQFHRALQLNPKLPQAWFSLGELEAQGGRVQEAIKDYQQAAHWAAAAGRADLVEAARARIEKLPPPAPQ